MAVRQRRLQANYLKVGENFEFLGTGFTSLEEKPSAKTTSKRYVNDSSSSQSITSYDWSTDFETDQIQSNKAIEYIVGIGEMCKTGADAESEYVVVDLDKAAQTSGYRARKFKVAIQVSDFKNNDGELQASGSFLGIGDPVLGTVTVDQSTKKITFTDGFTAKTTV